MDRRTATVLWVVLMIVVIVGVDVLFLRGAQNTALRLGANVGMVIAFGAGYLLLFRRP